jgi:hypothetical protein
MKNFVMYQLVKRTFTERMKVMDSVASMRENAGNQIARIQFMKTEAAKDMKDNARN